jgi:predicted ribosomally synthesized peptide with nif11-like leader
VAAPFERRRHDGIKMLGDLEPEKAVMLFVQPTPRGCARRKESTMSIEALTRFLERVSQEEALQEELDDALDLDQGAAAAVVSFGARHGFEFTADDLMTIVEEARRMGESDALSDEELSAVAGGGDVARIATLPSSIVLRLRRFEDPLTAFEDPLTAFRP